MFSLDGHAAFITGSTQGIGLEMARAVSEAGASVVLHGHVDNESAREAAASCSDAPLITADLSVGLPDSATRLVAAVLEAQPSTDLLVCNAGTYIDQPFLEMEFDVFQRTMNLNVAAQFVIVQAFARAWEAAGTAGRIILTGSINGRLAEPTHVAYDTSKGAIDAMVRSLAVSLAPLNIRVNGVAPGLFVTPLTAPALDDSAARSWMELHTPNGKVPGPDVVRGTTVYLLSDAAEHVHGQMLLVDGGMSVWQQPDPPANWSASE